MKFWQWFLAGLLGLALGGPLAAQSAHLHHGSDNVAFMEHPPHIGKPVPNVSGYDDQGKEFLLGNLKDQYTVLVFGDLTNASFLRNVPSMETVFRDYATKGVKFYYIYKSLAHPELKGYVRPFTLEERFLHVAEAKRTLGSEIPWIVDRMDSKIRRALGNRSNMEFVIDPQGNVVHKLIWSDPETLRKKLEEWVGPVENPTRVEDLNLKILPPPKVAASGIVPRLERPVSGHDFMRPVVRKPELEEGGEPFYAKLRAEADPSLLKEGTGRLWIGFFMDPLYGVYWDNLREPIRVTIDAPDGMKVSPLRLVGPKPKVKSDIDPREFLVDVVANGIDQPLKVTAVYIACHGEGWCKSLTQRYQIDLKHDQDGGNNPTRSSYGFSAQ